MIAQLASGEVYFFNNTTGISLTLGAEVYILNNGCWKVDDERPNGETAAMKQNAKS